MLPEPKPFLVVVSVPLAEGYEEAIEAAEKYGADAVEMRVDYLCRKPSVEELRNAFSSTRLPVIATPRAPEEGGLWSLSSRDRWDALQICIEAGAHAVDVELLTLVAVKAGVHEIRELGVDVIVSQHFIDRCPDLGVLWASMLEAIRRGASIYKVAVAKCIGFEAVLTALCCKACEEGFSVAVMPMGRGTAALRIALAMMGSRLLYLGTRKLGVTAPGQPLIEDLADLLGALKATAQLLQGSS